MGQNTAGVKRADIPHNTAVVEVGLPHGGNGPKYRGVLYHSEDTAGWEVRDTAGLKWAETPQGLKGPIYRIIPQWWR